MLCNADCITFLTYFRYSLSQREINIDGEMNLFILVVQGVPPNNYSVFLEHCAQKVEVWKYHNRRQGHEIQVM